MGKTTEINKQSVLILFNLIKDNMDQSCIHLDVRLYYLSKTLGQQTPSFGTLLVYLENMA